MILLTFKSEYIMKKTIFAMLFIATICTLFTSCKDETKWSKDSKLYIKGVDRANKALSEAMSVAEICQLDTVLMSKTDGGNTPFGDNFQNKIDRVNNRLAMRVANLETLDDNQFLLSKEVILYTTNERFEYIDTIGYVPYSQRYAAYEAIKPLWESEDWDAIYNIFQNAFTFIPCTGAEYKAMIENGEE